MKAVILAAGEGTRMRPLTEDKPKPMLPLFGRPLLEHIMDELPYLFDEVIVVVGYLGEQIQTHFKNEYDGRKITYVEQKTRGGTADALFLCKEHLVGQKFLMLYADDYHIERDLTRLLKHNLSVLVHYKEDPRQFGVAIFDDKGRVESIIEKPKESVSKFVVTGPAFLDDRIFSYEAPAHENGERYLADAIGAMVKDHDVRAVPAEVWIPIGYPADLEKAESILKARELTIAPQQVEN